ncbi:hypothetical protein J2S41_003815 [Catenuloplanes atrovinosus]|uniref:Uncharacterized protein n=2 Tax=Catenuloplanes atrovinosus TaxID=137266 RepID=A0AAE3YQZ1_9ACTN|nr:hypothetical protein [Catenuloplanes atrovinosus]
MVVQFLPVPQEDLMGPFCAPIGRGRPPLAAPAGVDEAEPVMTELLQIIEREALPYFARFTSVEDVRHEASELLKSGVDDPWHLEIRFRASLMLGDVTAAEEDAARIVAVATSGEDWTREEWVGELRDRTVGLLEIARRSLPEARAVLESDAAETRRRVLL